MLNRPIVLYNRKCNAGHCMCVVSCLLADRTVANKTSVDGKGFGLHIWDVSMKEEKPVLKVFFSLHGCLQQLLILERSGLCHNRFTFKHRLGRGHL